MATQQYTKPELRERLKKKIIAGTKGGRKGQWSARKAQLLAHAYKEQGGGYRGEKKSTAKHLDQWTNEEWTTADGKKARRGETTDRYLPKKAWSKLSASEKASTRKKKQSGSRKGKQFVGNTAKAKSARKRVTH